MTKSSIHIMLRKKTDSSTVLTATLLQVLDCKTSYELTGFLALDLY